MNTSEFRKCGKVAVDYIAEYLDNIRDRRVLSAVEPGYLCDELQPEAPLMGERWSQILADIDRTIMPGLTHWHSPHFHAYYPTGMSYPGIVAELLIAGLNGVSTNWASNPVVIELELRMMDWLAKLLNLPDVFLNSHKGRGGGMIQSSTSDSTLLALLVGKYKKIDQMLKISHCKKTSIKEKLVAYTSDESNSSVEKSGMLASVKMRLLPTDEDGSLRGITLSNAIANDLEAGLIPFCVVATLGTTGTCSFDSLPEIGPICAQHQLWLHIDAAYAGAALVCPEHRHLLDGIEFVDSFVLNLHKWLLVNSDCTALWMKDTRHLRKMFQLDSNLHHDDLPQIQSWQLPDTRRFRALKMWVVMRIYGAEGMKQHIRKHINLAKYLEALIRADKRFEASICRMGLVCFRLKGNNEHTERVLEGIRKRGKLFIMPYYFKNQLLIRFVICSIFTEEKDIDFAWQEIRNQVDKSMETNKNVIDTNNNI